MRAVRVVVYYDGATFEVEVTSSGEWRIYPECPIADIGDFLKQDVYDAVTSRAEYLAQRKLKEGERYD